MRLAAYFAGDLRRFEVFTVGIDAVSSLLAGLCLACEAGAETSGAFVAPFSLGEMTGALGGPTFAQSLGL